MAKRYGSPVAVPVHRGAPGADVTFDATRLRDGVSRYLSDAEAAFGDITPGVEKRVLWAGAPEARTDWAVVYVHGFSATSEELRPMPDLVAKALGANLVFTRLQGHGRTGAAMREASLAGWISDVAEALAVARAVADRVLVIGCSTGCPLVTLAMHDPGMTEGVAGVVFAAPNYRLRSKAARMLTWPGARWWLPMLTGRERGFTAVNADHARYWTARYPSVALLPMAEALRAAAALPHEAAQIPALFLFDPRDAVVDHAGTRVVAARWGAPARCMELTLGPKDDPGRHVVAGDILSPGMTGPVADGILTWLGETVSPADVNCQ